MTVDATAPSTCHLEDQDVCSTLSVLSDLIDDTVGHVVGDPRWMVAAQHAWHRFPVALRHTISEFRGDSGPFASLVIRGFAELCQSSQGTPTLQSTGQQEPALPSALLSALAYGLGSPIAYEAEKHGALVHNVAPIRGLEAFMGNAGSKQTLEFHVENAFHTARPDHISLLCIRPDHDKQARLTVGSITLALRIIDETTIAALFRDAFITAPPPSFGNQSRPSQTHAVLKGAHDDPDLTVDFAATTSNDPACQRALTTLRTALESTVVGLTLDSGDLAIVDNRRAVHGRSPFTPRYDGKDRWLQRIYSVVDNRKVRPFQRAGDHVIIAT